MTKTKAQLRAEAVERLKDCRYHTLADYVRAMLGWGHEPHFEDSRDALIDLLTDDCGPCYSCAKLAELRAENNALRVRVDELEADVSQAVEDTAERVTNQGEMLDTREKLEADCEKLIGNIQRRIFSGRDAGALRCQLKELLDRQAAITKREREQHWLEIVGASANCNLELTNQIAELREDVAERDDVIAVLKAENAELQAKVDELHANNASLHELAGTQADEIDELTAQLEAAHAKNCSLRQHIAKMQEGRHGWHVKGAELQREVDRLTRENIALARDLGECMAERDELKRENAKLSDDEFYLRCTLVDMNGEAVG